MPDVVKEFVSHTRPSKEKELSPLYLGLNVGAYKSCHEEERS